MKKFVASILIAAFGYSHLTFAQNNYPFDVKISGKGEQSIVFIPGFASSGDVWDSTKSLYEKDYTCYTLTMPGFAGTPAQPNPNFAGWEKGIADYIIQQKINKPIVVGHSMGGGLALAIAADYPDLLSKVVVVDAVPCLAAMNDSTFKSKKNDHSKRMIKIFAGMSDDKFHQMQEKNIPALCADSSKVETIVGWSMKSDRATLAQIFCDFYNTDLRAKIATIKCPCLILLEKNFESEKAAVEAQYRNCKTAQLKYATKGLHFIMYDDKVWYDQQMNTFIRG